MTDDAAPIATETPNTDSSSQVSRPLVNSKPYDDDMMEAYAEESEDTPKVSEGTSESVPSQPDKLEPDIEETKIEAPEEEKPPKEEINKATKDDKVIDGLEELPIKRMINGKEVEFKIKDAIESHVKKEEFNREMSRRVNDVARREKVWQSEQSKFKDKLGEVIEAAQQGDFVTGIRTLAKLAKGSSDLDVTKFEQQYFDQLENVRKLYAEMTPEQRDAYFAKRRAAEAEARAKNLENEKATTVAQSELKAKVESLMTEHQIPPQEFWGNYKALVDNQVGEGKRFKDDSEVTAEEVVNHTFRVRHWHKVYQAGEKLGITDDSVLDEVGKITAAEPSLTVDDIAKVIQSAGVVTDPRAVENLNRKAGKSRLNSTANSTKKDDANGYDKESMDFLYRNQPKAYTRVVR